jgi:hypothetical protein
MSFLPPRSSPRGERWQEKKSERLRSPRGDGRSRSPPVFPGRQASCHLTTDQVTGYRFDAVAISVWALPSRWRLAAGGGPLGSISSARLSLAPSLASEGRLGEFHFPRAHGLHQVHGTAPRSQTGASHFVGALGGRGGVTPPSYHHRTDRVDVISPAGWASHPFARHHASTAHGLGDVEP